MRTSIFWSFLLFSIVLIQLGCHARYYNDYSDKSYTIRQHLIAISSPENDFDGKQIVKLEWRKDLKLFPTAYAGLESTMYQTWRAYPVEKIPKEILSKHLQKEVKITYKVVMFNNPPLIYIQSFELLEK